MAVQGIDNVYIYFFSETLNSGRQCLL